MRVRWFGHFGRLLQAQGSPDFRRQVSITEHADDTPTGKLMEAIIESVDEFCSENLIWGTAAMDKVDPGRVEKVFPLSSQRPWSAASTVWVRSRAPRIAHPRRAASAYMFSGLVECYRCERALSGRDSKSGRLHHYVCQSLLKRGN